MTLCPSGRAPYDAIYESINLLPTFIAFHCRVILEAELHMNAGPGLMQLFETYNYLLELSRRNPLRRTIKVLEGSKGDRLSANAIIRVREIQSRYSVFMRSF